MITVISLGIIHKYSSKICLFRKFQLSNYNFALLLHYASVFYYKKLKMNKYVIIVFYFCRGFEISIIKIIKKLLEKWRKRKRKAP